MKGFPNIDEMEPEAEAPPEGEAPPAEEQPPEEQAAADDEPEVEGNVSEDEQAQYEQFVASAIKVLYSQSTFPQVMQSVRGNGDPVQGLASTVVNAIVRVQDAAAKAGDQIAPEIIFQGGREILEDLAETAELAGVHTFSDEEIEAAGLRAIDLWRDEAARRGELDEGAAMEDMRRMKEADAQGRLGEVVPGIDERAGAGRAPAQEEDPAALENGEEPAEAQNEGDEQKGARDENQDRAPQPEEEDPEAEAAAVDQERRRRRRGRRRRQSARGE